MASPVEPALNLFQGHSLVRSEVKQLLPKRNSIGQTLPTRQADTVIFTSISALVKAE